MENMEDMEFLRVTPWRACQKSLDVGTESNAPDSRPHDSVRGEPVNTARHRESTKAFETASFWTFAHTRGSGQQTNLGCWRIPDGAITGSGVVMDVASPPASRQFV